MTKTPFLYVCTPVCAHARPHKTSSMHNVIHSFSKENINARAQKDSLINHREANKKGREEEAIHLSYQRTISRSLLIFIFPCFFSFFRFIAIFIPSS